MKKNPAAGLLLLAALLAASCATTTVKSSSFRPLSTGKIAVMPLSGEYGEQAADMIGQELLMRGFRLVERTQIDKVMRELGYVGDKRFDPASLPAVGKKLGLQAHQSATRGRGDGRSALGGEIRQPALVKRHEHARRHSAWRGVPRTSVRS